jgi:hypothetical protein
MVHGTVEQVNFGDVLFVCGEMEADGRRAKLH